MRVGLFRACMDSTALPNDSDVGSTWQDLQRNEPDKMFVLSILNPLVSPFKLCMTFVLKFLVFDRKNVYPYDPHSFLSFYLVIP